MNKGDKYGYVQLELIAKLTINVYNSYMYVAI